MDTIEIRKRFWSTSIRISKSGGGHVPSGPVPYQMSAPQASTPAQGTASEPPPAVAEEREYLEIKSPMVGTFYAQPEPGADPYVRPGGRVRVGQTLCIIEAMKIMNPLDSEVTGVVVERLVEDAQPVEFGQVLFKVDPNG